MNGQPSAIVAVYQLPGSNAVDAAKGVKKLMETMRQRFPQDMDYKIALDQTASVTQGIKEIVETLVIALLLVILVVYIFLQGWRATLIPLLAVPVSLVGTFIFFPVFGFSINTLSLFGLVLAIGLVVDDAIVVVEGVERHIEEGMTPKDSALKAMEELSGPVVGIALVLSAVFRAHRVYSGHHRPAVPAVRRDDRNLGAALRLQRADAESGAGCVAPAEERAEPGTATKILRLVQSRVWKRHGRLRPRLRRLDSQKFRRDIDACDSSGGGGVFRQSRAVELPARRRPGLCVYQHATSQCGVAATHGRGFARGGEDSWRTRPASSIPPASSASAC